MKKILIFFAGLITGIIVLFFIGFFFFNANEEIDGLEIFDSPGQIMSEKSYRVFQVVDGGYALANAATSEDFGLYLGIVVLLYADENSNYYDGKIINASKGQIFRQVGTYRYQTKDDNIKTVPVIAIFDK